MTLYVCSGGKEPPRLNSCLHCNETLLVTDNSEVICFFKFYCFSPTASSEILWWGINNTALELKKKPNTVGLVKKTVFS